MSANVGTYSIRELYVGSDKIKEAYIGSDLVYIQPRTFRFGFANVNFDPSTTLASSNLSWTLVNASRGIWDAKSLIEGDAYGNSLFADLLNSTYMGSITCGLISANTTGMTNAYDMFRSCSNLTTICKMDFSSVTNIYGCFRDCAHILSIPLLDLSNVEDATYAFYGTASLVELPNFNFSSLTSGNFMCSGSKIRSVPNWNLPLIERAGYMFSNCANLETVPLFTGFDNILNVSYMFNGCRAVQSGSKALYDVLSTKGLIAQRYAGCFRNCGVDTTTGAAELAMIPSDWK